MIRVLSVVGKRKRGKTAFAMSAPKPMILFDFELGVDRVEPKYILERDKIKVVPYIREMLNIKGKKTATAQEFWEQILTDFNAALMNPEIKSIGFDTFSSVWEVRRMAYLAEIKKRDPSRITLAPTEYFIPNTDMKMILTQALLSGKTLILVHHTKEKWVAGKPTEEEEPDGFKYTGDLVDMEIWMHKKKDDKGIMRPYGTIQECGLCMAVEGQELAQPTYDLLDKLITVRRGGV